MRPVNPLQYLMVFQDAFNDQLPSFKQQLLENKAIEIDPEGVKAGIILITELVNKELNYKSRILDAARAELANPGGDLLLRLNEITGARLLVLHFLSLGMGDWLLSTPEGRALFDEARTLKDGEMLAAEISRGVKRCLDHETRQAALNLLTAPANRLSEKLNRLLSTSTRERRLRAPRSHR